MSKHSTYKDKMNYLDIVVWPQIEAAFKRGDNKYTGDMASHADRYLKRSIEEDIRHIRELHVDVRLREAEEMANNEDYQEAMDKIVSAIGYLVILHMRTNDKLIFDE